VARARDDDVRFEVEAVVVDGQIHPDLFRLPSFQGRLTLGTATPVLLDNLGEVVQQLLVSSFLRIPLKYPEMRPEWEKNFAQPPDWQRLEIQDAALAPVLAEMVKRPARP
jgi:hypothetical protein